MKRKLEIFRVKFVRQHTDCAIVSDIFGIYLLAISNVNNIYLSQFFEGLDVFQVSSLPDLTISVKYTLRYLMSYQLFLSLDKYHRHREIITI